MLQIKNISKKYTVGDLTQQALDKVNFNLRDNEFVAILGQSGSGKTTLLNIIGGLDRYDEGDLIINEISTKKYKDRDWDSYRNHTIGFVFQSYNLIPHQTVLSNVELALTISGISKSERRRRAKEALCEVGLEKHLHKKPNQMSGGQMQRVAIARALVNDPDILLADEPTGALDSQTSVQVMELLREVAKNRLVVMVTHNPELAEEYANRTIRLHDGQIVDDTNPYEIDKSQIKPAEHKNMGKSSMSLLTALSLSFNNLRTKKGRTLLTAFAGSIGIIGIAMILSLSTGVNTYITDIQKETMTSYPITIEAQSMDLSSIMELGQEKMSDTDIGHELDKVYSNSVGIEMVSNASISLKENNLTDFKAYLDNEESEINQYLGENGVVYSYDVNFNAYTYDPDGELVNTDGSDFSSSNTSQAMNMSSMFMSGNTSVNFRELLTGSGDQTISTAVTDSYDVMYGNWPTSYDEVVLVVDTNNEIATSQLYELGILPSAEYKDLLDKIEKGEEVEITDTSWSYEEIADKTFLMVPSTDYYQKTEDGLFEYVGDDKVKVDELIKNAIELKIVGIVKPNEDATYTGVATGIGYTRELTDYLIEYTNNSDVIIAQEETPEINVLNGMEFKPQNDQTKVEDAVKFLSELGISEKAGFTMMMMQSSEEENPENMQMMMMMDEAQLAAYLDQYLLDPDTDAMLTVYDNYIDGETYDNNMSDFGYVSLEAPSSISLYSDSFENKDMISKCIEDYNATVSTENQITYTDYVGLLMSSITTIIDVISYVLIAFVGVSLIVSSIMIGIITYISVLERTKEIGILRALGASKSNISQVFNAETFIVGLCAGLIGVGITLLLHIPINAIVYALTGLSTVKARLPLSSGIILVLLSMGLTLIAGLLPSKTAAGKDPVTALRTE